MRKFIVLSLAALCVAACSSLPNIERGGGEDLSADAKPAFIQDGITRAPGVLASFGAAMHHGELFIFGGHNGTPHDHSKATQSSKFLRLNKEGTWTDLPGGVALQSVALVSDGKLLYRVGGMQARNEAEQDDDLWSTDEAASFDPATLKWTDLPKLPVARSSHDAIVLDGKLFVFGGWKLSGSSKGEWPEHGYALDLADTKAGWKEVAQPFQRRAVAVAGLGGKVYVLGGLGPDRKISQRVDIYDVKEGKWSVGPELPGNAFGCSACEMGGRLYATDFTGSVVRLSTDGAKWESVASLAIARFFHRLLPASEGKLVAVCGSSHEGHTNTIEWLDVSREGPRVSSMLVKVGAIAKQRQGAFLSNEELIVFGGNTETDQHMFEKDNFSKEVWRINFSTGDVKKLNDLPVQRQSLTPLFVTCPDQENKTHWLAFGGFGFEGEETIAHAQSFMYDHEKDTWSDIGVKLPMPLTQFGVADVGGIVWLFGGMDFDPRRGEEGQFALNDKVYRWDPHSKEGFVEESTLPRSRRAFGYSLLDGKFYMVGGLKQSFGRVEECDVFDIEKKTWATMAAPSRPRISPQIVAFNGKLYMAGGSSPKASGKGTEQNESVEVFDPKTGKWSTLIEKLPVSSKEAQLFATPTRLLLYSAARTDGNVEITFIQP
jgi:N-acetylneuraminic acid mutarotase